MPHSFTQKLKACTHSVMGIALALAMCVANAQNFPVKPIKLVVPFAPGGVPT